MSQLVKYGNKILRNKLVSIVADKSLQPKIDEMTKICIENYGYALAANQIGWDASVIVVRLELITQEKKVLVIINPVLEAFSEEMVDFDESCLSLPTLKVKISRPDEIRIRYTNLDNQPETLEAKGLLARVLWHELDHLKGKLIIDYMTPFEKSMIENKLKRIKRGSL